MVTRRLHPLAPVVALDIDGTLGDYHKHFHRFVEMYLQRHVPLIFETEYRGEFSDALGLEKHEYRQIKLAYRQGGMKRSLPVFPGAPELVHELRIDYGVQVWICTTRPWNRLDNIDPDTQFWINRNLGRVDGVIYGEEKYEDLLDIVGRERVVGVLDDLPENVAKAHQLGLEAKLIDGKHNRWAWSPKSEKIRVKDLEEARKWLLGLLTKQGLSTKASK